MANGVLVEHEQVSEPSRPELNGPGDVKLAAYEGAGSPLDAVAEVPTA